MTRLHSTLLLALLTACALFAISLNAQTYQRMRRMVQVSATDTTAPTLPSASIATNGTTVTLNWSEAVTRGAGWNNGDIDLDGTVTNNALTYVSGDGTSAWAMTAASTINTGETVNLDFNGDANSVEDGAGNDLAAITNAAITNNSTAGGGTFTAKDSTGGSYAFSDLDSQYDAGFRWQFVAGSSYTLTKVAVDLTRGGTGGTGNITVVVYDSAGTTLLATSSAVAVGSVPTSHALVDFAGLSLSLTSGTTYQFGIIYTSGASGSGTDKIILRVNSASAGQNVYQYNGTTWNGTPILSTVQGVITTYTSP